MKGTMQAKLTDVKTKDDTVFISVINVKSERDEVSTFPVTGIALKKIQHIVDLLTENSSIDLELRLIDQLSTVEDFSATVNGVEIDFREIERAEKAKNVAIADAKAKAEARSNAATWFIIKVIIVIVAFVAIVGVLNNV